MPILWNEIKPGLNSSLRCVLACWQNVSYSIEYVGNFMRVLLNLLATFSFSFWFSCLLAEFLLFCRLLLANLLLLLLLFKLICNRLYRCFVVFAIKMCLLFDETVGRISRFSVDVVGEMFLILYNSVDKLGRGLFFVCLVDKKRKKRKRKKEKGTNIFVLLRLSSSYCSLNIILFVLVELVLVGKMFHILSILLAKCYFC